MADLQKDTKCWSNSMGQAAPLEDMDCWLFKIGTLLQTRSRERSRTQTSSTHVLQRCCPTHQVILALCTLFYFTLITILTEKTKLVRSVYAQATDYLPLAWSLPHSSHCKYDQYLHKYKVKPLCMLVTLKYWCKAMSVLPMDVTWLAEHFQHCLICSCNM